MFDEFFPYYKLDENNIPVKCKTIDEWADFHKTKQRYLFHNKLNAIWISTVFLGLDHSFDDTSAPVLFESMSFNNQSEMDCDRYTSYDDAKIGHYVLCKKYGIFYINPDKEDIIGTMDDL